jgi:hypothetical protein
MLALIQRRSADGSYSPIAAVARRRPERLNSTHSGRLAYDRGFYNAPDGESRSEIVPEHIPVRVIVPSAVLSLPATPEPALCLTIDEEFP